MSPSVTTFLFETLNFLALAGVLSWFFFSPVRNALRSRQEDYQRKERELDDQALAVEQRQAEIDQSRRQFQEEMSQLRETEMAAAKQQAEAILREARTAAQEQHAQLEQQLWKLRESQQTQLAEVGATAAAAAVGKLLEDIRGPALSDALLEVACRQFQQLSAQQIRSIEIETAVPLSDSQRDKLQQTVGEAGGEVKFRIQPELIDGVRIVTNVGLVDSTIRGLVQFTQRSLAERLRAQQIAKPSAEAVQHV